MRIFVAAFVLVASIAQAQVTTTHGSLKLIHAKATKTSEEVSMKIIGPQEGQLIEGSDVTVKFTAENWQAEQNGKHFHFILDDQPFRVHFSGEPFVFKNVSPGIHVIRAFPVYRWHESVKRQEALAMVSFYVKERTGSLPLDFSKPMMIYSTPEGTHSADERLPGQPHSGVLVDWFLHNVSMGSRGGYFVRLSVDGEALMSMKEWRPHYIQGFSAGEHRIKLELLKDGKPLTENWNTVERSITVR